MNEMELLRRLRSDVAEPGTDELNAAEARLVTAVRERRRPAGWSPRIRIRTSVLTGAVAAAVVGAVLVVGLRDVPRPARPEVVPAAVTQLLDRAARAAERTPELNPRPDQFILYKSLAMYTMGGYDSAGKETRYLYRTDRRLWSSVDGKHDGAVWWKYLAPRPYPGWPMPAQALSDVGKVQFLPALACQSAGGPDWARHDYPHLTSLPTDANGMLDAIRRSTGQPSPTDLEVWRAVGGMLAESYLPPAQRAAVFRAAKLIPGVTVVQGARDAADRTGVAIARIDDEAGVRAEIIFDPKTYLYLGEREFVVDAAKAAAPVGSQISATAELSVTVVDATPKLPTTQKNADGKAMPAYLYCK
jgi:hypothetical protein